jgi:hypothetical protein
MLEALSTIFYSIVFIGDKILQLSLREYKSEQKLSEFHHDPHLGIDSDKHNGVYRDIIQSERY